jgi:hypothetical protein
VTVYVCINTKLIFNAPHQVGASDMPIIKQSTSGGSGSSGRSYEVLRSQARKIDFRVYRYFSKIMRVKMNEADLLSRSFKT